MSVDVVRRRFTVDEYQHMAEAGILTKRDRVELLDGEIVEMTPSGIRHGAAVSALIRLFVTGLGERAVVWPQLTIRLSPRSAPEPDVAIARRRSYRSAYPTAEDVLLLIEVADTSLRRDRDLKLPLYAEAGIREYWIVDVSRDEVKAYTNPSGSGYASVQTFRRGESVSPSVFPDLRIAVDEIFA
jgi:Uma2 family endonuclease